MSTPLTMEAARRYDDSFCYRCYNAALQLLSHGARMEEERDALKAEFAEARQRIVELQTALKWAVMEGQR